MRALALALALSTLGCGGAAATVVRASEEVERHRHIVLETADPNGIAWDDARHLLYVADDDAPRVLVLSNGVVVAERGLGSVGAGAGGLVQLGDGSLAVVRYGAGDDGGVVRLLSDEAVRPIPGLDGSRHRLGAASWGELYVAWYTGEGDARTGGVARVDAYGGGETDVLIGLGKAAGVAVIDDLLVVSDQNHDSLVVCHLPDCEDRALLAAVPTPDLMTATETEVLVSSGDGSVYAVDRMGRVRVAVSELGGEPRGLAWDAEGQRLFVAVHDPHGSAHSIAIVPFSTAEPPAE